MNLFDTILQRNCKIGVFGLGQVGATVAGVFSNHGFDVFGCDVKVELVAAINSGKLDLPEKKLSDMIKDAVLSGSFVATTDASEVASSSDVLIICVQTPISAKNEPDLSFLNSIFKIIGSTIKSEKLIIIESTIPPGTSRRIAQMIEQLSGLRCGKDFWFSYCPERLTPGNSVTELYNNEKLIGGIDQHSAILAKNLYSHIIQSNILLTDIVNAELSKLSENTFRAVNIAFANELALICEQYEADVMDVIKLANTHPRVNIHIPGCGVGGPCLPKDPHLLLSAVKKI